jgi:hypothetical protein
VDALRRIHAALVDGGVIVDTQPVSARPAVTAGGVKLGALDMREWAGTIEAVDRAVGETIDAGLFALDRERRFVVADSFNDGAELVQRVSEWAGTRVHSRLAARVAAVPQPARVHQDVRLRVLRALAVE